ncbi:MAG: hypothetical protein HDS14_04020 [Bacteroides sp.]|nr:hypothetical protein [Bacteroides sp.]
MKTPWQKWLEQIRVTGSIQTEFLVPYDFAGRRTDRDKTTKYEKDVLNNTYFDLTINAPYVSIGGRFEWAKWPLPGYEDDFKGWGVPYFWATGRYKGFQLTAGDFYEQFGSGLILRTYQERSLGVDNAIRGGRLKVQAAPGLNFTFLGGKQRRYWEHNPAWLWGADGEWSLNDTFKEAFGNPYGLSVGFSYVGKKEPDEDLRVGSTPYRLHFPNVVAAFDGRVKLRLHDFNILAEFATKTNDPTADNDYTYRRGTAALLSVSYAAKGFSAFVQAKRSDNMSFRSKRSTIGISSFVNHLPAFTMTQTYALAAMYPYATQPDGEWAFQGEVRYLFKKKTPLGGKYGTSVRLSGSYIASLDREFAIDAEGNRLTPMMGTDGYGAPFWKMGGLNYADINFELNKKISRTFQFTLFYLFQRYNQSVVEGHGGMVTANTFIFEGQNKLAKKVQLRYEAQFLRTVQDKGNWWAGLIELSVAPHWMFTVTDTYNSGQDDNFYNFLITYNVHANRFTLGYGRTREGYNCSGGVCRWVPETKGFSLTYNYTF